jgi:hypothetical protein
VTSGGGNAAKPLGAAQRIDDPVSSGRLSQSLRFSFAITASLACAHSRSACPSTGGAGVERVAMESLPKGLRIGRGRDGAASPELKPQSYGIPIGCTRSA